MLDGCACNFGDALAAGLNYGRGTGPGYWHERTSRVTFPKAPPTQFTPNERVMVAESRDMFYGLDGLGLNELSVESYGGAMLSRIDPMPPSAASTIFARADHDLVGHRVDFGHQDRALGAVRWPQTRMGTPRTAYVPRPTFAPKPVLAPMVSPAILARARKKAAALQALRRRRTAQLRAAQKATRAVARWR